MATPDPTQADLRTATDAWRRDRRRTGARLRAAREAAGLSQLALAAASGVPNATVSRLERGQRVPAAATVRRLAAALAVAPTALTAERPAWSGPVHGRPGVLADDGELAQCHLCGGFFGNLGGHVRQAHGVGPDEYKERFGLKRTTALLGPALKRVRRTRARARVGSAAFAAFQAAGRAALAALPPDARSHRGQPVRLEQRLDPAWWAHLARMREVRRDRRPPRRVARAAVAAEVGAAWGGRLRVTCVVCGTTFAEPHSKRTRQTCGPSCYQELRQRLVTARRATEAADREGRRAAGLAVRGLRRERGLTQAQLAAAAGVSAALVSLVERGRLVGSAAAVDRLAAVLGVDPTVLAAAPTPACLTASDERLH